MTCDISLKLRLFPSFSFFLLPGGPLLPSLYVISTPWKLRCVFFSIKLSSSSSSSSTCLWWSPFKTPRDIHPLESTYHFWEVWSQENEAKNNKSGREEEKVWIRSQNDALLLIKCSCETSDIIGFQRDTCDFSNIWEDLFH